MGEIIDAQVHTWSSPDDPRYPWDGKYKRGRYIDMREPDVVEKVIADMDATGVDAALLVAPGWYAHDNSYAIDSARKFPDRLAVVARVDWKSAHPKRWLEELMSEPTVVGIRLTSGGNPFPWGDRGEFEPMLSAAEELDIPVCVSPGPNAVLALGDAARRHPDLRIVIDHLGFVAPPFSVPEPGPEPFKLLPNLLYLAEYHPNIHAKLTGTAALSNEPYPFRDIWDPIAQIVSAFGVERVMWGTDYNRTSPLHSYEQATYYLAEIDLLDDSTKQQLYSGTVRSVFGWPPPADGRRVPGHATNVNGEGQ